MKDGQKYAVWFRDDAARAFLGLDTDQPQSRWVVLGECIGEEWRVGFWLRVDHIEQWTAMGRPKNIAISPPECLIPWSCVITIQALGQFDDLKPAAVKADAAANAPGKAKSKPSRR
jgi:hypothetical protein